MKAHEKIWLLYRKDLLLEARTKITAISVFLFAFLVLLIFNFAFKINSSNVDAYASGILWITFSFSGILALSRLFDHERTKWAIRGVMMAPLDYLSIYLSKVFLHLTIMIVMEVLSVFLFVLLFNPVWDSAIIIRVILVSVLATVGFSSLGVLVSSMLFNERLKDLLLPLVFYPIVIPLVIMAVKSTAAAINSDEMTLLPYIAGFDVIFLVACALLFDFVLEGD